MNAKIIIAITAVVIIAAGAGGAYYLLKDKGPETDYTLLDSNMNIKKGLTIEYDLSSSDSKLSVVAIVDSVENGKALYHTVTKASNSEYIDSAMTFSSFTPTNFVVNYTKAAPDSMEIEKDGNVYTLNGKTTKGNMTYILDSLKITYDGSVRYVDGKMTYESVTSDEEYTKTVYKFMTFEGKLMSKVNSDSKSKGELNTAAFYEEVLSRYKASDYSGTTITESTGRYHGVEVKIYTINGTSSGTTYKDAEIYTYKGYTIKTDGIVNGERSTGTVSIYIK